MQEKLLKKIVEEVLSQKCETNHVEIKKAECGIFACETSDVFARILG